MTTPAAVRAGLRRLAARTGSTTGIWLLAAVMISTAVVLVAPQLVQLADDGPRSAALFALLPLFAVAEVVVIHLPTLRNAHSHTLREIPAVAGLAFLAPGEYVVAYVVACGLGLALGRRQRGMKLAFNVSMFALEAALGMLTYRMVLGDAGPADPRGWVAAFAAVLVTDLVSAVAVTAAISLTEGRVDRDVLRDAAGPGLAAAMVNTCMALLVVVLVVHAPLSLPLLAVALLVLVVAYRAHVALGAGYSRLQHLYQFVGSAERHEDLSHAVATVLSDAREVLRADNAELVLLPHGPGPGTRAVLGPSGTVAEAPYPGPSAADAWWAPASLGEAVLRGAGTAGGGTPRAPSASFSPRDGLAAPLRADGRVYGVLVVSDRSFEGQTFTLDDLRLFETLAAHAAVALDKARLVDRLRRLAAERAHEARHDSLTGLPNRRAFHESIATFLDSGRSGAVLFLDLDDFKDVNDTLGHDVGDMLLHETGRRLGEVCTGTVARLGGDEFAVLLPGVTGPDVATQASEIRAAVARPVLVGSVTLNTKASIGVAYLPEHGTDTNEVLRHADVAMYEAKRTGVGVAVYRPEGGRAVARKLVLAADLPAAIAEHRFEVWYQPHAEASTGRLVGAEALLRWTHPTYGSIPPAEVVSLADRVGCLRQLTDAVLEDALRQRAAWAAAGLDLHMSVNITAHDLGDEGLPGAVRRLLDSTGTPAGSLTLEITESGVMSDPERCLGVLDRLAGMGVRLSVDDFGTGYSSLAYLDRLPVHEVKIDRSFVQRLDSESAEPTVVRATIALAHDLGMRVVAEGVETRAAWARVAALGAEIIQGYGLAKPMSPEIATAWLLQAAASAPWAAVPTQRTAQGVATGERPSTSMGMARSGATQGR